MKDSLTKIRSELTAILTTNVASPASPVEMKLMEICDRLACQLQRIERKIDALDNATSDARLRTARF